MLFLQRVHAAAASSQRSGVRGFERKIKEMIVAVQLEKRYTKREILTLLRQPDQRSGTARTASKRGAHVLRQVREGPDARGGRDDCGNHPDAGAPQPVRQPDQHAGAAQQLRAAADGGRRLHHAARRPRTRRARPLVLLGQPTPEPLDRALLRRRHPQDARTEVRRRRAVPGRSAGADDARRRPAGSREPRGRSRPARASTSGGAGSAKPPRNVVAEGRSLDRFTMRALVAADPRRRHRSGPRDVRARARSGGSARIRIGTHDVELPPSGVRVDAAHIGGRSVQGRRPHRGRGADARRRHAATSSMLEQAPAVEGALVAIDNRTGQIRAMVGGFSFARSKFNRATQARRQVGSLVQALRLHDGHRPRLHAGLDVHRRAGVATRPGPTSRRTSRSTTTASSKGRSRCAARSNSRATFPR